MRVLEKESFGTRSRSPRCANGAADAVRQVAGAFDDFGRMYCHLPSRSLISSCALVYTVPEFAQSACGARLKFGAKTTPLRSRSLCLW